MRKFFLASSLLLVASLVGQNVSLDLQRIVRLAPTARASGTMAANPALDTIVGTLAYFAGAPDASEIERLRSGPELLYHYRDNSAVQDYLIAEKLYELVEGYLPDEDGFQLELNSADQRSAYLLPLAGTTLFSRGGTIDIDHVRRTFQAPATTELNLSRASEAARQGPTGLSPSNLIGNTLVGLSDWITRRAQEELTYTFLNQLREDIQRNDLQQLFPATAGFLPQLDLLNYRAILPSVRRAFEEDLNGIAYNLGNYLTARGADSFQHPTVYQLFLLYRVLDLETNGLTLPRLFAFTYGEIQEARADVRKRIELRLAASDESGEAYQRVMDAYAQYANDSPLTSIELKSTGGVMHYGDAPNLARFDLEFSTMATKVRPEVDRAANLTVIRETLALGRQSEPEIEFEEFLPNINDPEATKESLEKRIRAAIDEEPSPALNSLLEITRAVKVDSSNHRIAEDRLRAIELRLRRFARETDLELEMIAPTPTIDDSYTELLAAVRAYSATESDTLVRAYQNLSRFETVLGLTQQLFFLLADSGADQGNFLEKSELAFFYTDAGGRRLLNGITQDRLGRVSDGSVFNSRELTNLLLDFGGLLADSDRTGMNYSVLGGKNGTVRAVDLVANSLAMLLEADIFVDPLDPAGGVSFADRHPAFAKVGAVGKELNELFRLSRTGEYRYSVDNLLNLLQLFDLVPPASKKQQKLLDRRTELEELIANYAVNESEELTAIALAVPSPAALPLLGDKGDAEKIARYQSQLTVETDPYGREEIGNSMRDLKLQRIRGELQRINSRLDRLDPERYGRFREQLFRYGTFMADVAAADTPDAFEAALSTVALPPGSSQIKRNRPSSVELGAYFGLALGQERLSLPAGVEAPELEENEWAAALFVPVGVSYSRRLGYSNSSITLFGSLLDLGALTAFRLGGEETDGGATVERFPDFRPRNIIAPGLHLMYNFPKSPFTLGVGIQDGPSIRKFTTAGSNVEREARAVRGLVSLSVDVPIFRFFNR